MTYRPPKNPQATEFEIGVATLAKTGERVINLWEIWMGGFEIVDRCPVDDPSAVRYAAEWAVEHRAIWKDGRRPVRSIDEVLGTFIH